MHGDFSRRTFDPAAGYRSVLLQQGRVLLDAEWNEQTDITAYHDERRALDTFGPAGAPYVHAGFGIVNVQGTPLSGQGFVERDDQGNIVVDIAQWGELYLSAGRYYVDGVLCELPHSVPLGAQPSLPEIDGAPGLPEPDDGTYLAYLDVWQHHVTFDEEPRLLESALGGPDTATRSRTVCQVRLQSTQRNVCSLASEDVLAQRVLPTMAAALTDAPPNTDPCQLTSSGGYQRLENQLYRVQIHEAGPRPTYLWSRENGSIVSGLAGLKATTAAGMDTALVLTRTGRDEELSIGAGDIVEVTSTTLQLHGRSGFLATAGSPDGNELPVKWQTAARPGVLADLGRAPIVRRWEGGPTAVAAAKKPLEGGIEVTFPGPAGATYQVGDHWLIPARTVRLAYGLTAQIGTIEWPKDGAGASVPLEPIGIRHRRTPIALLRRAHGPLGVAWSLVSDCRTLTPTLAEMTAIDLLGGDGQAAVRHAAFSEPVRVVVRQGGRPVPNAWVRFASPTGHLDPTSPVESSVNPPQVGSPNTVDVLTGANGQAEIRWMLDVQSPNVEVLTATLLDDRQDPVGAEVQVTGRRLDGGCNCFTLDPRDDIVAIFKALTERPAVCLCFAAGVFELPSAAVMSFVGSVEIRGHGAATRIVAPTADVLQFLGCRNVRISDLTMAAGEYGVGDRGATLAVIGAADVSISDVTATCPSRSFPVHSCIRVDGLDVQGAKARIERCTAVVGDLQRGIDVQRVDDVVVSGCRVTTPPNDEETRRPDFFDWIGKKGFAQLMTAQIVQPDRPEDPEAEGYYRQVTEGALTFGLEAGAPQLWKKLPRFIDDLQIIQDVVEGRLLELANDRPVLDRSPLGRWLASKADELTRFAFLLAGISVLARPAARVVIDGNSISDAIVGIEFRIVGKEEFGARGWLEVKDNLVAHPERAVFHAGASSILVQALERTTIRDNMGIVPFTRDEKPAYAAVGVRVRGALGHYALVSGCSFDGHVIGVRVDADPNPVSPRMRRVRDTILTLPNAPLVYDPNGGYNDDPPGMP